MTPEAVGEAAQHMRADHVAADAGAPPGRDVERAEVKCRGALGGELEAEARRIGDRRLLARDHFEPQKRTAREVAGRQIVDRQPRRDRRQHEADEAHVVVERQPRDAAVAGPRIEPVAADAGRVRHQRAVRDRDALREPRRARRELEIGERVRIGPDEVSAARDLADVRDGADDPQRQAGGGFDQPVAHRRRREGGCGVRDLDHTAQRREIGLAPAERHRQRHWDRHGAGVEAREEQEDEVALGVSHERDALAGRDARAEQAAGERAGLRDEARIAELLRRAAATVMEVEALGPASRRLERVEDGRERPGRGRQDPVPSAGRGSTCSAAPPRASTLATRPWASRTTMSEAFAQAG